MPRTAVIFDMDGVIVDSADAHLRSWQVLAGELQTVVTAEQFAATFGRQNRDIVPLLFGPEGGQQRMQELAARKEAIYRDLVRGQVPAVPGAVQLVRACREAGLRLAIGSSAPVENIDLVLAEMGIRSCFEAIVHDGDVTRGKPAPDVYLAAAQRIQTDPAECVVIEDAPSGIAAARSAGMAVVGLTTQHGADALGAADRVVDSLTELTPESLAAM